MYHEGQSISVFINAQCKDVNGKQYTCILEDNYYLKFHSAHFKLTHLLSKKLLFSLIKFCHCVCTNKSFTGSSVGS